MKKKNLTFHERVRNADASQQVENVKACHSYYHARADATSEWTYIWSKSDECSWAHQFGRMRGVEQMWYGSVTQYDMMSFESWLETIKRYPEIGGKDPRPIMECSVHTLVTDIIEVADDGMSARGSFITPGVIHSVLNDDGKRYCNILWERYGSDFVFEDGKWVYLHEQVCPDLPGRMDCVNWAAESYAKLRRKEDPQGAVTLGAPPPVSDPGPLHNPYSPLQTPQDTVPWPKPYATLDGDNTYTPPGEIRDIRLPPPGDGKTIVRNLNNY